MGLVVGGILLVFGTAGLYYVIRAAVRDGIEEAWQRRAQHVPGTPAPHRSGDDEGLGL